jgi:group I intron endonuclease
MSKIYSIYKIQNLVNGKCYIGFTQNTKVRFSAHRNNAKSGVVMPLYGSMRKHGIENFSFEVIYQSKDRKHTLVEMEPKFIEEYKALNEGYNMSPGGANTNTPEMTERASKRMRENNPMTKLRVNRGTFKKGVKNYVDTPERREKLSITKIGERNPNYGKKGCFDHLNNKRLTCPHCGVITTPENSKRWHFDNCRNR